MPPGQVVVKDEVNHMADADMFADIHVLGSVRGYSTIACSPGVRETERQELEQFQFGELSTADAIARLGTHVLITGRPLNSGRFALSRMLPGSPDDIGRPTVEVVTVVLEASTYDACVGMLAQFASDAGFWRGLRAAASSGTQIRSAAPPPGSVDLTTVRLFDLWRAACRSGAIGVVPDADSDALLRFVALLHPSDRRSCRWGIGLLSLSTTADICSVASGVQLQGPRDVMRIASAGVWHCGGEGDYVEFRVASGLRSLPSTAEVASNGRTKVHALDAGVIARDDAARGALAGDQRRLSPVRRAAIGSAILATLALAIALNAWRRPAPVAPASIVGWTSESGSSEDGSTGGPSTEDPSATAAAPDSLTHALPEPEQSPTVPAATGGVAPPVSPSSPPVQPPGPPPSLASLPPSPPAPSTEAGEAAASQQPDSVEAPAQDPSTPVGDPPSGGAAAGSTPSEAGSSSTHSAPTPPDSTSPPASTAPPTLTPLEQLDRLRSRLEARSPREEFNRYSDAVEAAPDRNAEKPPNWGIVAGSWVGLLVEAVVLDAVLKREARLQLEARAASDPQGETAEAVVDGGFISKATDPWSSNGLRLNTELGEMWRQILGQLELNLAQLEGHAPTIEDSESFFLSLKDELDRFLPSSFVRLTNAEQKMVKDRVEKLMARKGRERERTALERAARDK